MKRGSAAGLAVLLLGCNGESEGPAPPTLAASILTAADAAPPRRPSRRYYLARSSERCEIYVQDHEERTDPFNTPCPDYMLVGERIRIAGMTCTLENQAQPQREKPVVCPDPLTRFEKEERAEGR